jgi:hypothetical protein
MLTERQIVHFKTFGFLIFRDLFSSDELRTLNAEFECGLGSAYRHMPFDGSRRHWLPMMGASTPFFASLLEDPRFLHPTQQLYGEDVIGYVADANRYVGDTNWHPDTGSIHQYGVKFAYYLQPVGAETGALRVIPGSHKKPLHSELRRFREAKAAVRELPAYVCESEPGDVVAFDLRTWHASCGGSDDRRMCTLVYYNNPKTPEEEEAVQRQAERSAGTRRKFGLPDGPLLDPYWVANPEGSLTRQRWIARLRPLGFLDAT